MKTIEDSLRDTLRRFTYRSSRTGELRSLMQHHIDALMETLLPWMRAQGLSCNQPSQVKPVDLVDECKNCGLPMGSHVSLRATWTERHGWDGGSPSVLVCPAATYQAIPTPSTPDLDSLLPGDPEPRLAGEEGEDG